MFKHVKPGDLLLILGNTFHGGSAHSSVESRSRSRLLHDLDDLKFFIHCPGLNDPPNPNSGTIESAQLFLSREIEVSRDHINKHGCFVPAFFEFSLN